MKCNRCGKETQTEMFCAECEKYLKNFSSKKSVEEFEELIEENKNLNDLDNTKELVDLDKLVEEELLKEEMKDDLENKTQTFKMEEKNSEEKPKSNKKKLIIIISVISIIFIIGLIILILVLNKKDNPKEEIKIDYESVIKFYGDEITDIVKKYKQEFNDIPTWQYIVEKLDYDRYEIKCDIHNIYKNGSVYLSSCKVDNKKTKVEYGKEIEEIKEGKKLDIYKREAGNSIIYNESSINSTLVGTITCKTEKCNFVEAFDKYVLIEEEGSHYLYDYINNTIIIGPFKLNNEMNILKYNNTLYGILYEEEGKNNIYSVSSNKVLKDIKGQLLYSEMLFDPTIMYKYNYAIFKNNNTNSFVNLKTGNVSYEISGTIDTFIQKNDIVYITAYKTNPNSFKIYNSNGKLLFDGIEYNKFIVGSTNLLVSTKTNFKVYDNKLNLKTSSRNYDDILGLYEKFVVALKGNDVMVLDINDNILATIKDCWNNNYTFNLMLSKSTDTGISIVIDDNKSNNSIEYYYYYNTKEIIKK